MLNENGLTFKEFQECREATIAQTYNLDETEIRIMNGFYKQLSNANDGFLQRTSATVST